MEHKKSTSFVPLKETALVKAQNTIVITNKILTERTTITQHMWDWWNNLSDIWKKIFNAEIGKIENKPSEYSAKHIYIFATKDTPDIKELIAIFKLQRINCSNLLFGFGLSYIDKTFEYFRERGLNFPVKEPECWETRLNAEKSDLIPLKDLKNLTDLNCNINGLTDLSSLKDMKNLTTLKCFFNQISDLSPLKDLKNLTYLDCSSNKISDLSPLQDLTNLNEIHLRNNPIPASQIEDLQKALPKTKIYF